jgi:hypothetical protein
MKKETPIKRFKRKRKHIPIITWNSNVYETIHMPDYLADDFIREFNLMYVPSTIEFQTWLEEKIIK